MKAVDYVNKYGEDLTGPDDTKRDEAVKGLIIDLNNELTELAKVRNVSIDIGAISIIKELNQKWNAINSKLKIPVLSRDGYKNLWISKIPQLEGRL